MPSKRGLVVFGLWLSTATLTLFISFFLLLTSTSFQKSNLQVQTQRSPLDNEFQMYAALPAVLGGATATIKSDDGRAEILRQYLARHKSPLEPYSQSLVAVADNYGLDFRLLPAIAMQESNLCKKIPDDSYNCWGFGIYGEKVLRFRNYEEAIERVAKTLRKNYVDKGLITPELIMAKYAPPSVEKGGPWAQAIQQFFKDLE